MNPGSGLNAGTPLTGTEIRHYATNEIGCTANGGFPPNYFDNSIALISRGTCTFEEKINNPAIRALLDKVRVAEPPTENLERYKAGAVVTIRTRDGRSHTSTVYAPRGAAMIGIAWADVEAKYRALGPYAKFSGDNLEASIKAIRGFGKAKNVAELIGLLR